jgi:hypothetical protein
VSVRHLRPDEDVPDFEPRGRYRTASGYVRVRWLLGPNDYVEEYEHRLVMERPTGEVHHVNGDKADNRPENLVVLSKREHATLHAEPNPDSYKIRSARERAQRAQERRAKRAERIAEMRALYESGLSTTEIGSLFSMSAGGVSRALRQGGAKMRPRRSTGPDAEVRATVQSRAGLRCERCGRNVAWEPHEIHHVAARGMGGTRRPEINDPENLVLLCRPCHAHVEGHPDEARAEGFKRSHNTLSVTHPAEPPYSRPRPQ